MLRAVEVARAGSWSEPAADRIRLDYDARCHRRMTLTAAGGLVFLLDLPRASVLQEGDGLRLEDGRIVQVEAAREPLMAITCADAAELARIAWHLGNRHLPTEIRPDRLVIRADHVIAAMLEGLGAEVAMIEAPFNPEGGAYAAGHHGHDNGHDHDHHSHSHD
jgi:urease accessory protein